MYLCFGSLSVLWLCDGVFVRLTHQHVALLGCQFRKFTEAIEGRLCSQDIRPWLKNQLPMSENQNGRSFLYVKIWLISEL